MVAGIGAIACAKSRAFRTTTRRISRVWRASTLLSRGLFTCSTLQASRRSIAVLDCRATTRNCTLTFRRGKRHTSWCAVLFRANFSECFRAAASWMARQFGFPRAGRASCGGTGRWSKPPFDFGRKRDCENRARNRPRRRAGRRSGGIAHSPPYHPPRRPHGPRKHVPTRARDQNGPHRRA